MLWGMGVIGAWGQSWEAAPISDRARELNEQAAVAEGRAAIRLYAQAIRADESNGAAWHGLGMCLLEEGRAEDAYKAFRRLNKLYPDQPMALSALAAAMVRMPGLTRDQLREGLNLAERAANLAPEDGETWYVLSVVRHANGDYERALAAARRARMSDESGDGVSPEVRKLHQQQEVACLDAIAVFSPLD